MWYLFVDALGLVLGLSFNNVLFTVRVRAAAIAVSCLLDSISWFITFVSLVAALARLLRKLSSFLYVSGVAVGPAALAWLNGLRPPVVWSSRFRSK